MAEWQPRVDCHCSGVDGTLLVRCGLRCPVVGLGWLTPSKDGPAPSLFPFSCNSYLGVGLRHSSNNTTMTGSTERTPTTGPPDGKTD